MVAAQGDKMLTLAAEQADIVAIAAMGDEAQLADRVSFVKDRAGDRLDDIELQFGFFQVSIDDPSDLSTIRLLEPDAPEAEVRKLTTVIEYVKSQAGERINDIALSFGFLVAIDNPDDALMLQITDPDATPEELRQKSAVLSGPVEAAAEKVHRFHDRYGFTKFNFSKTPSTTWDTLEKLVAAVG